MGKQFVSVREAAKVADISPEHLRRLIREKKIKACPRKQGQRKIYLPVDEVEKYMSGK